jgi:hypothetical protein
MLGIRDLQSPTTSVDLFVGYRKGLRAHPQDCNRLTLKIAADEEDYDLCRKDGQNYVGRPRGLGCKAGYRTASRPAKRTPKWRQQRGVPSKTEA